MLLDKETSEEHGIISSRVIEVAMSLNKSPDKAIKEFNKAFIKQLDAQKIDLKI